ncbi:MAG: hypothetical protein UEY93_06340 [Acutalibacteraceae bacterium]|nr:hypothetical protein [Acutalibacteraceae bacterium]
MKTRKVGKIVSLLVAIVLVATIMIPAASVLADSSEYAGVTWTEVGDFASLKQAFDNANKTGEKTYIRLTSDITLQRPYFNSDEINGGSTNWAKMYIYSTARITKIEERRGGLWSGTDKTTHDFAWLMSQANSPFNVSDPNAYFYGYTEDELKNGFLVDKGMQDYVGMGRKAGQGTGNDEKIGYEYSERMLVVNENADITVDLYGKTMKASDYNPYDSTPAYQMSAIKVNKGGALTVVDLSSEQTGTISGGTGNVYYKETVSTDNSEHTRDAMFNEDWTVRDTTGWWGWLSSTGKYNIEYQSKSTWVENVKESRGGGIYVENGGVFTLKSGKISGNQAFMEPKRGIFAADVDSYAKGGGVYVEAGGVFNMFGGEVSKNATRSFFKNWSIGNDRIYHAYSEGGGIYLEGSQEETVNGATVTVPGAVFNMTGGKIAENATYAQGGTGASSKSRITHSSGAGIYVGTGAVCNIKGADSDSASTNIEMMKNFPQVVNNSCGGQIVKGSYTTNSAIEVKGGGIYNDGTVNIKNALIASNDFSEARQSDAKTVVHIMRDEYLPEGQRTITYSDGKTATLPGTGTDLALYVLDYWEETSNETYGGGQKGIKQRPKTYITRLDDRFTDNLQLATEEVAHGTSGIFGSVIVNDEMKITSDGAGVCVGENGKLVVGERTWITDNYDFLTNGHMAVSAVRNYKRFWAQNKTVVDDRVYKTNDYDEKGASYTDPAGGWVYYGDENENVNDGYAYSDTSDDVYLPDGAVIYKGGSLFESKIGVNYWNMVNADGSAVEAERGLGQAGSRAGNRVIVATGKNLDASFWGDSVAQPAARDIQFFYANDNNKNWEKENYQLPSKKRWDNAGQKAFPVDPHLNWNNRARVAAVATTDSAINKDASPFEGYVNFDVAYPSGYWKYGWAGQLNKTWDEESYRISDSHWTPSTKVTDPDANNATDAAASRLTEFANSSVNFPQRSYQLTAEMKTMNKSYLQAKYIDYKVVYDTTTFGTEAAPVLRFGKTDSDTRNMYVTVNFDEANKHYYGLSNQPSFTLNDSVSTSNFTTSVNPFLNNLDQNLTDSTFTFYGANKPKGTIDIAKVVPDYSAYGKSAQLNYFLSLSNVDRLATQTSISKGSDNKELTDLYFKGWQFYTSYEYGPEVVTLDNKVERQTVSLDGSTLDYRGYFAADLSKIFNSNVNAQPCPSMTALWYSKEELAEARKKVSNVMFQTVQRKNDDGSITDLLRFVAIAGSQYPDFDEIGFVISTTNATPTIEGGYDFVVKSRVYEKLGVNRAAGAAKTYYDVDKLLGGTYSGHQSVTVEDAKWSFTKDSQFAANVTTGATGKAGYKDAGLFYTNIVITDANKDTVYFVTPYAKMGNTYFYGESRAACYADAPTA